MRKSLKVEEKQDYHKKFEEIHYYGDTDINKYVDAQTGLELAEQIEDINNQIEKMGKICDNKYKNSEKEYKLIIKEQRDNLDGNLKDYISSLRSKLANYREKINFDYNKKFEEIHKKTLELTNEFKKTKNTKKIYELENTIINEDNNFLQKQITIMEDLNVYLKFKVKYLLDELRDGELIKTAPPQQLKNSKDFLITNIEYNNTNITNLNNGNKNIETDINKYKIYCQKNKNKTFKKNNENQSIIQETNREKEINEINNKLDLMYRILYKKIDDENNKNIKLQKIFEKMFIKTNNPYLQLLKTCNIEKLETDSNISNLNINKSYDFNKIKRLDYSPRSINSNGYSNSYADQSTLPSVQRSSASIKSFKGCSFIFDEHIIFDGFKDRNENKKTIIKFLEKIKIKKLIYHLMYDMEMNID